VKLASIKEVDGVPEATQMVRHLVAAQEATARTARSLFPLVEKAHDQPTADLLTQRLEVHEKTAWMLRSLLET
jgi:starvation-inducible DNA-binding protein